MNCLYTCMACWPILVNTVEVYWLLITYEPWYLVIMMNSIDVYELLVKLMSAWVTCVFWLDYDVCELLVCQSGLYILVKSIDDKLLVTWSKGAFVFDMISILYNSCSVAWSRKRLFNKSFYSVYWIYIVWIYFAFLVFFFHLCILIHCSDVWEVNRSLSGQINTLNSELLSLNMLLVCLQLISDKLYLIGKLLVQINCDWVE